MGNMTDFTFTNSAAYLVKAIILSFWSLFSLRNKQPKNRKKLVIKTETDNLKKSSGYSEQGSTDNDKLIKHYFPSVYIVITFFPTLACNFFWKSCQYILWELTKYKTTSTHGQNREGREQPYHTSTSSIGFCIKYFLS